MALTTQPAPNPATPAASYAGVTLPAPSGPSQGLSLSPKDAIVLASTVGGAILGAGAGSGAAVGLATKVLRDLAIPGPIINEVNRYAAVFGAAGGAAAGGSLAGNIAGKICDRFGIA